MGKNKYRVLTVAAFFIVVIVISGNATEQTSGYYSAQVDSNLAPSILQRLFGAARTAPISPSAFIPVAPMHAALQAPTPSALQPDISRETPPTGKTTFVDGNFVVRGGNLIAPFAQIGSHSVGIGRDFLAVTGPMFGIRVGGADMNEAAGGVNDFSISENGDIGFSGIVTAQSFQTSGSIEVKDNYIANDNGMIAFKILNGGGLAKAAASLNKMVITSDGRVGIGTDTPAATLDVNGTVKTKGVDAGAILTTDLSVRSTLLVSTNFCLPMDAGKPGQNMVCFKRLCPGPKSGQFILSTQTSC